MSSLDTTLLAALLTGIGFPAYALLTSKKTIRILEEKPDRLTMVYKETSLLLVLMGLLVILTSAYENVFDASLGLNFIDQPIWILSLIAASLLVFWLMRKIKIPKEKIDDVGKNFEGVQHILPKNLREYKWVVATAFIAGVFEEIIFRGFLVWKLNQYLPLLPSFLIANLMFGIAHATTRLNNAIKAFVLGLIFSLAYYLTGSLWLSILLHIVVDLYAANYSFQYFQEKAKQ